VQPREQVEIQTYGVSVASPVELSLHVAICLSVLNTFFRIYMLELPRSFSTSEVRSRDISADAMFPKVHSASPTIYMLAWFKSLEDEEERAVSCLEGSHSAMVLYR